MSVGGAIVLMALFHEVPVVRYFLEALLRVSDLSGTTVLTLALALTLGSIVEFILAITSFSRDFSLMGDTGLLRLSMQSFAASIIGGACAYTTLAYMGGMVDINTLLGVFSQGAVAGIVGLCATGVVLYLLKNPELREVMGALGRRFRDADAVAVEPSDIS